MPSWLGPEAEALHLADRTAEALQNVNEAIVLIERFEERSWLAELYRLRGVFLAAVHADGAQIVWGFGDQSLISEDPGLYLSRRKLRKQAQGMKLRRPSGPGKSKLCPYRPEIESRLVNGQSVRIGHVHLKVADLGVIQIKMASNCIGIVPANSGHIRLTGN